MCGRDYSTYSEEELWLRYESEKLKRNPLGIGPNYNVSPTHLCPVVLVRDTDVTIELFRWGLIPFWAKDVKSASKYSLINAKGEEISEKRSYKAAFENRRCIVPVSGFFEWHRVPDSKTKHPFAIHLKDEPIMSIAGVWEHWISKETGEEINSFSIVTTEANSLVAKIHDRMPVILARQDEWTWLDPENHDTSRLKRLMKPCPSQWLDAFEISTLVNSPKNNSKEILRPIEVKALDRK